MSSVFKFKEFEVAQDQCAMKIGTDAVLLGAWVKLNSNVQTILDVGAGTGVIALQLAQRSQAIEIDAVEVNSDAFEQCVENFENSPWGDRLFCYHASFEELAEEPDLAYDLIVSNPPFFQQTASDTNARYQARFTQHLSFKNLLLGVNQTLNEEGSFACILPAETVPDFIQLAKTHQLHVNRICEVRGQPHSPVKRCLLQFSRKPTPVENEKLTIEISRHEYTEQYIELTKDFYLKM